MADLRVRIKKENVLYDVFPDAQSDEKNISQNNPDLQTAQFIPLESGSRIGTPPEPFTFYDAILGTTGGGGGTTHFFRHRGIKVPNLANAGTSGTNPIIDIDNFFEEVGSDNSAFTVVPRATENGSTIYDVFYSYAPKTVVKLRLVVIQIDNLTAIQDFVTVDTVEGMEIIERNQNGKVVFDVFLLIDSTP